MKNFFSKWWNTIKASWNDYKESVVIIGEHSTNMFVSGLTDIGRGIVSIIQSIAFLVFMFIAATAGLALGLFGIYPPIEEGK